MLDAESVTISGRQSTSEADDDEAYTDLSVAKFFSLTRLSSTDGSRATASDGEAPPGTWRCGGWADRACDGINSVGETECQFCGFRRTWGPGFDPSQQLWICPGQDCGHVNLPDGRYCVLCMKDIGVDSVESGPLYMRLGESATAPWYYPRGLSPVPAGSRTPGPDSRRRLKNRPILREKFGIPSGVATQAGVAVVPLTWDTDNMKTPTLSSEKQTVTGSTSPTRGPAGYEELLKVGKEAFLTSRSTEERLRAAHSDTDRRARTALDLRPGQGVATQVGTGSGQRESADPHSTREAPVESRRSSDELFLVEFPYMAPDMVEKLTSDPRLWRCWVSSTWAGLPKWIPTDQPSARPSEETRRWRPFAAVFVTKEYWGRLLECLEVPSWDLGSSRLTTCVSVHPDAVMVPVQMRHVIAQGCFPKTLPGP